MGRDRIWGGVDVFHEWWGQTRCQWISARQSAGTTESPAGGASEGKQWECGEMWGGGGKYLTKGSKPQ